MTTLGQALEGATALLEAAGVANPRSDARLLIVAAAGLNPQDLLAYSEKKLPVEARGRLEGLLRRRAQREPISRILQEREFWSLPFRVTPDILDPRPDSETLIQAVLDEVEERHGVSMLLDLGTGSGCLLIAALSEFPSATGLGVDISVAALQVARANARANGIGHRIRFLCDDWAASVSTRWDVVICNPPYVAQPALAGLEAEVREYDPLAALLAGQDGLAAYRKLLPRLSSLLEPRGFVALEIGAEQAAPVAGLAQRAGLVVCRQVADLHGVLRCLILRPGRA